MGHREQLLEAAQRLLTERGYAHITARDLVAASDTNLASIGYHFGSKAALLNAAIEASFEQWAEQLASLVMADADATPIQRGMATWVSVLRSLPRRRPMLQSYVEALAQAQHEPRLRAQLAEHYRQARERVAGLVALSLRDGTDSDLGAPPADDPRCRAIAAFVIAVCDGLSMQWLLDPEGAPDGDELLAGLAMVWETSFPDSTAPTRPQTARTAPRVRPR